MSETPNSSEYPRGNCRDELSSRLQRRARPHAWRAPRRLAGRLGTTPSRPVFSAALPAPGAARARVTNLRAAARTHRPNAVSRRPDDAEGQPGIRPPDRPAGSPTPRHGHRPAGRRRRADAPRQIEKDAHGTGDKPTSRASAGRKGWLILRARPPARLRVRRPGTRQTTTPRSSICICATSDLRVEMAKAQPFAAPF